MSHNIPKYEMAHKHALLACLWVQIVVLAGPQSILIFSVLRICGDKKSDKLKVLRSWFCSVEQCHGRFFCAVGYVDVRLHAVIVGVASPFHDRIRGNAHHEGVTDEGATATMGAEHLPLGLGDGGFDASCVGDIGQFLVEAAQTTYLFQIIVHFLIADDG